MNSFILFLEMNVSAVGKKGEKDIVVALKD